MLNLDDKKKIAVTVLLLIIVIGSLAFIKGFNKKQFIDDLPQTEQDTNNPSQSSDKLDESDNVINNVVEYKNTYEKNEEIPKLPDLDFETNYQVELGSTEFTLPEVIGDNDCLTIELKYYFKAYLSNDFIETNSLTYDKLGTYKVTYIVSNCYNQTIKKDIYIEVIDQTAPKIEGFIEEYDENTEIISYIPVNTNSVINKPIKIVFSDNDSVSYAEYYKAIYENNNSGNTIEEENMMQVIDIDLNNDFYLYEDGEYHIRAYDNSGNYQEYIITIDRTNPVSEVTYTRLSTNQILVTIKLDEKVKEVPGFTLSEDEKVLTKIYSNNTLEDITISDLAGNTIIVPIKVDQILTVKLIQNDLETNSTQLNLNDGNISVIIEGNSTYSISYTLNNNVYDNYISGTNIISDGHYDFIITSDMGIFNISFDVSSQTTSD